MKRLRILLVLTALTIGTSAFAGAQEFHKQPPGYLDRDDHFSRDRGNGVEFKPPVYDKDDRGRNRDHRGKVEIKVHGRYESRDCR